MRQETPKSIKPCSQCGTSSVLVFQEYKSTTHYHCLSMACGYIEEYVEESKLKEIEVNELISQLETRLSSLLIEIDSINGKKIEAEEIYSELKSFKVKVANLPWTKRGWKSSTKFTHCSLCDKKFKNRQEYKIENDQAICRYVCS